MMGMCDFRPLAAGLGLLRAVPHERFWTGVGVRPMEDPQ